MPVPISSHINAAAPRGKEEIGLKCRYLSCPTPCSNTESRGTCPKTFQAERTGEAEWRSRGSSSDMLSSPVVWSGLRCLAPFYSSANQAWFHKDSSSEAHSSGHSGNYNILDCWVKTSWSCHFCSSFPVLMRASLHPFPFSLFAVHFFPSHLTLKKTQRTRSFSYLNCKKDFWAIICIRKSILVFIFLWISPCSWTPDDVLFFMVFIGIPHEATCCWSDHIPELCLPFQSWDSPALLSVVSLCCPRTQKSFSSFFNSSDFSELQLERDGLVPGSSATEHLSRSLAELLLSEVALMLCLR